MRGTSRCDAPHILVQFPDEERQFEYYEKSANFGHARGKLLVGWCLYNGKGTKVDIVEASKYYKAAAEAGDDIALCHYGHCMLYGTGVEMNVEFAVE